MKISQILETSAGATGSGSVAPVSAVLGGTQTRNQGIYPDTKGGNLLKGKKTKKAFANSLHEGAVKTLSMDLKSLTDKEFIEKYKKTKAEMQVSLDKNIEEAVSTADMRAFFAGADSKKVPAATPNIKKEIPAEIKMLMAKLHKSGERSMSISELEKLKQYRLGKRLYAAEDQSVTESNNRCMQCGMPNCSCAPGKCGCKPIAGWIPNKGFKKVMDEQGVAEGSLNEFAPDGFNGGDDNEGFSPEIAKMAQEDGFTKGAGLADGATLARSITINHWHSQHGGMYKQYFAKGFKAGRMNKISHDNKQYNLNLKLMKDGSIRHGEQGVAEADKHSFVGKIQRSHELKGKVDQTFKDIGTAQKQGDHPEASKAFRKHERYANLERPGTWTKVKEQGVAEAEYNPDTFVGKKGTYKGYGITQESPHQWGISSSAHKFPTLNAAKRHIDKVLVVSEQGVAEVSQQTLQSYRKKAAKQKSDALDVTDRPDTDDATWVKNINIASKRKDGIAAANKRLGVAEGLPQTLRKVVPGHAKREIDKKMDAGKFGKTDADKDANFQRYKKIQDKIKEQGVAEGAPELLKAEMPLVRHIDKELARDGYVKGTKEYHEAFKNAIAMYRQFGNVDAIRKHEQQGVTEVAPPGAKAERMVKDIKKSYAKDGKLTPKEKAIAYATAWKAHNKGQVEESEINEADLIMVPGQGHKLKPGFISKDADRTDREVEMALSDLFQAHKNSKEIFELVKNISEEEGLEGWVQEKIIKSADYLNTIREYLEGKFAMGQLSEEGASTVAKTWDQMTPQEKISGVKGRTVWNPATNKYRTVFDVPAAKTSEKNVAEEGSGDVGQGGLGTNYPGTYEETHGQPRDDKMHHNRALTTESAILSGVKKV